DALRLTNQLLLSNSQMSDLWDLKFKILDKMGRKREAIAAAKEGLRVVPSEGALLLDVAKGSLDVGDLDTAQQHAELAVVNLPSKAHEILAHVWYRRGDVNRAESEAKLSLKNANDPTPPLMQLASIEKGRDNLRAALAYLDQAEQRENGRSTRTHEGLHATRADVLARLGRNADAEQEFRVEIEHFPQSGSAYASLILLLASKQRLDDATKLVFELIKNDPAAHSYVTVSETLKAIGDDRGAMYWAYQGLQKYPKDSELRALARRVGVPAARVN